MPRIAPAVAALVGRGLAVFPVPTGSKTAPPGWHQAATTDPVVSWPAGANIGVACRASGIVGLDLDHEHGIDGAATLTALCAAAHRPWPATFTVGTPHGLHLYFWAPTGLVVASRARRWPGIDVRAPGHRNGGYLIGSGSVVDGHAYTITRHDPVRPLPRWLTTPLATGGAR